MSVKRPAYIEQSDIGTKPSQVYGWDEAPKRISSTTDGAKERLDTSVSGLAPTQSGKGGKGIVIIRYKTDGSDGVSTSSTGGTITTSGSYTIHSFTTGGTFGCVLAGVGVTNSLMFNFF